MNDFSLSIPDELIERVAESIAERAFDVFAERAGDHDALDDDR